MPHRFNCADLGRHVRRRRASSRGARDGRRRRVPDSARRWTDRSVRSPFDKSKLDPGYVKGYVPGVRENGGQYTHAALWTLIAFAMLGDGERAGELFSLLNPINHSSTRAGLHKYKVEPYVAAGD